MKRFLFTILLLTIVSEASTLVVRASKTIKYKELINKNEVFLDYVDAKDIKWNCKPVSKTGCTK